MEHTKEPWHVECDAWVENSFNARMWPTLHSGEFEICGTEGFYSGNRDTDIANARRIVACVNACQHISTESLESGVQMNLTMRAINAERQRDELLAALIEAREIVVEVCTAMSVPLPDASIARFDDAIAKAEQS